MIILYQFIWNSKKTNQESSPIINGCGSYNITLDFRLLGLDAFTQCCNSHDLCYDTCSQSKDSCDRSFSRCLIQSCDSYAVQNSWASVQKFSKLIFTHSQKDRCFLFCFNKTIKILFLISSMRKYRKNNVFCCGQIRMLGVFW